MILGWLLLCVWVVFSIPPQQDHPTHYRIIPHFVIAPEKLERARADLVEELQTSDPTIIIISPDHFDSYKTNDLVFDSSIATLCVQGYCQQSAGAWRSSWYRTHQDWSTLLLSDHWIGTHLRFIQNYVPDAKVAPLLVQARDNKNLKTIITQISKITKSQETIVIGSVDRSHYVPEPRDLLHDHHTWTILNNTPSDRSSWQWLDVDCPSCLWIVDSLARAEWRSPRLVWRDSSAELFGSSWFDTTSRALVRYDFQSWGIDLLQWVTLLFAWDLIYDRWVSTTFSSTSSLQHRFRNRFQEWDISSHPYGYYHRLGAWVDVVGFNLESPLYRRGETCYTIEKPMSFCSEEKIFDVLQPLWFNLVALGNNHRFDAGISGYETTKDILTNRGISLASDDVRIDESLYGVDFTIRSYDFTAPRWKDTLDQSCRDLEDDERHQKQSIVIAHRWEEYQSTHNTQQEYIATKLVQCGADAILWTHPHVVQDIQWIEKVPVLYSLWNFLMDQWFSDATQVGMMAGLVIPQTGSIQLYTWMIGAWL